jgi:hypothetical protein
MGRRTLLLSAIAGTLLGPVGVAHGACVRASQGPRLDAQLQQHEAARFDEPTVDHGYDLIRVVTTTSVRVCDRRTGRTTVLARGRVATRRERSKLVYARGREILRVSAAGHYVAWTERITAGAALDRSRVVVVLAAFPGGKVVRRRIVHSGRSSTESFVGVVVNRWRDLVWSVPYRGVWLWRAGRAPRLLTTVTVELGWPVLLDDGRTLMWDDAQHLVDLRAPRQRDGCPDREGFATVASTAAAFVTRARLAIEDRSDLIVWRTCWRAEHRDHVVFTGADPARDEDIPGWGSEDRAVDYAEPWLLLYANRWTKYQEHDDRLILVDVRTGDATVVTSGRDYVNEAVLLGDGSAAWISTSSSSPGTSLLRLARAGAGPVDLDSGGALTGLVARGSTLAWLHDGQPRSYVVPGA